MPGRSRRVAIPIVCLVALSAAGMALALPGPFRTFFLEENLHEVVPGVYRSAQPSPGELEEMIRELGLRSILNLRGERGGRAWLRAEREVAARHGIAHYSVHLNADRMPPSQRLREVVHILDSAPRPLLIHCKGGVERSGLVAAIAVLLNGGTLEAAWGQFAFSKGFVQLLGLTDLPMVLDDYQHWLASIGRPHTPERLRRWIETDYAPYYYRARIDPLDAPTELRPGAAPILHFRVTNESTRPIRFRNDPFFGSHLGGFLERPDDGGSPLELRGRHVDLILEPGRSTEMQMQLPTLQTPGHYVLRVDLVDEVKWFADMGSTPIRIAFDVD